MTAPSKESIERLLRPRSVAIVGASPTPGALGANVLASLERLNFAGAIHLINPRRDEIGGRPCLKSVDDLPLGVDAAVLAIPRAAVLETVKALARRKVGGAIIFSAGFAEGGEEGLAEQREIARVAHDSGMVVEGPNCLGMINFVDGVALTFVEMPAPMLGERNGVGIVSQSGAMAAVLSVTLGSRDVGVSYSVSTGNEAASGVEDYVGYLIDDPRTKVISLIVEQFRQPKRFLELAGRARRAGKPVVLLHPGRSSAARESAATHTGAMAGDYQVMRVKVERAGVFVAENLEELGDITELCMRCARLPRGGAVVLAESGAFKAMTLDLCEEIGLALPEFEGKTYDALRAAMPDFIAVSNPVDLTAQALVDPGLYKRTLAPLLADESFGSIVLAIIQTDDKTSTLKFPPIIEAIDELKSDKPIVFAGLDEGAVVPEHFISALRERNVAYFPSTERAFRAIARVGAQSDRDYSAAPQESARLEGLASVAGVVPEYRAKELLARIGMPFPPARFVTAPEDAARAAQGLGFPIALKAQSPRLSHKSDAGGVILGLNSTQEVTKGWDQLFANVKSHAPDLSLDGVLVEKMGKRGLELIVGARSDPDWGPVILAGFGGVQAEILKDVRLLPPDLPKEAIIRELNLLKMSPLLRGFRGSPPLDVGAVAEIISRLGRLLMAEPSIREVDLNPVVVYPEGEGAVALDALMLVERKDASPIGP